MFGFLNNLVNLKLKLTLNFSIPKAPYILLCAFQYLQLILIVIDRENARTVFEHLLLENYIDKQAIIIIYAVMILLIFAVFLLLSLKVGRER